MKKLISLLLCLMLLLPAAALAEDGWIANADYSDEEWQLIRLLGLDEDYGPYEFKAPEGAAYITLICWKLEDGQWTEILRVPRELTAPESQNELTITVTQQEDGSWRSALSAQKASGDIPDGRIYISTDDVVNGMWVTIQQDENYIALANNSYLNNTQTSRGWFVDEPVNTYGMHWSRRCFIRPDDSSTQERIAVTLNETIPLDIYVCYFGEHQALPPISAYNTPESFAGFDYVYAVTATFTAELLPEVSE